jgi:hypothetical protein
MSLAAAAGLTKRHRNRMIANFGVDGLVDGCLGGLFESASIQRLLAQQGCKYLRFYYGEDDQGKQHVVLVGADEHGNDLLGGASVVLQNHWPCPPICHTGVAGASLGDG